MAASFNNPKVINPILTDVNAIQELLGYLAQMNPSQGNDYPTGSIRLQAMGANNTNFQIQRYDNKQWQSVGQLQHDVTSLNNFVTSRNATANTIPVYNATGQLVGSITGNAATATKLQTARKIDIGGIVSADEQYFDGTGDITIPITQISINNKEDTVVKGTLTVAHGGTGNSAGAAQDVIIGLSPQGADLKAKTFGQIGVAAYKGDANFNDITTDGRYVVWCLSGHDSNQPHKLGFSGMLEVYSSPIGTFQRFSNDRETWVRVLLSGVWKGWTPLSGNYGTIRVYVSESGNDDDTGLESGYPVRTIARALQVGTKLVGGKALNYMLLNIGRGNWGTLDLECPGCYVAIEPITGAAPSKYSDELPKFDNINVNDTYLYLSGVVVGVLRSMRNSFVYITSGYKKFNGVHTSTNGYVFFISDSAATNVLELGTAGQTYACLFAAGGTICIENYLNIKLVANTNCNFLELHRGGRFIYHASNLVIKPTDFTNSGRKYALNSGSEIYNAWSFATDSIIEKFPGTQAGSIGGGVSINGYGYGVAIQSDVDTAITNTQNTLNNAINGKVSKSGDTMSWLTVESNSPTIGLKSLVYEAGVSYSGGWSPATLSFFDKKGSWRGCVRWSKSGNESMLSFCIMNDSQNVERHMYLGAETGRLVLPVNPDAGSNSTTVATTYWVRTLLGNDYLGMCPSNLGTNFTCAANTKYAVPNNGYLFFWTNSSYRSKFILYSSSNAVIVDMYVDGGLTCIPCRKGMYFIAHYPSNTTFTVPVRFVYAGN